MAAVARQFPMLLYSNAACHLPTQLKSQFVPPLSERWVLEKYLPFGPSSGNDEKVPDPAFGRMSFRLLGTAGFGRGPCPQQRPGLGRIAVKTRNELSLALPRAHPNLRTIQPPNRQLFSRMIRALSRCHSRSLVVARLSALFLPRARASSTLARPRLLK